MVNVKINKISTRTKKRVDVNNLRKCEFCEEERRGINSETSKIKQMTTRPFGIVNIWTEVKHAIVDVQTKLTGPRDLAKKNKLKLEISRVRRAKENWMREQCRKIEDFERKHDGFKIHKKVKSVTGNNQNKCPTRITVRDGRVIAEPETLCEVWKKYTQNLFKSDRPRNIEEHCISEESPAILGTQIPKRIQSIKSGRAAGPDDIYYIV